MSSLIYIESKTVNTTGWQREMPDSQPEEAAAVNSIANYNVPLPEKFSFKFGLLNMAFSAI